MNSAIDAATGLPFHVWSSAFDYSETFRVGKSRIQGEGLISRTTIAPETILGPLTTPFPSNENPWPYSTGAMMKINHAKPPNATAYRVLNDQELNVIYVKTTREVQPDEEITMDYDLISKLGYGKARPYYK